MIIASVETWVEAPLARYVEETRARLALLLHSSGQVVAQAGFTRAVDVMTACALAAAVNATASELGRQLDGTAFHGLFHSGAKKQFHLANLDVAGSTYICLTVFDGESSLGLVRMYFSDLCRELKAAAPEPVTRAPALGLDFERDLNKNLAALFGRA
jgi:predicted regulator of Ras-like GTPase activity (Roadblock/LC7/MglB family)